jgi:hypothetical protein
MPHCSEQYGQWVATPAGLGAAALGPARSMVAPGFPPFAPGLPVVERVVETTRPQIRASARPATLATPALRT